MTVQLSPELEALVMKDVERGPYRSIDDFVEQAVTMLHEARPIRIIRILHAALDAKPLLSK